MTAVAVTGASGFLGSAVCGALAARGFEVRALVRDPASYTAPPGVTAAGCDLPDTIDPAGLAGAAAVVHCAYATRETDLERARRVNEGGTRRLLEAARAAGARVVFISTIAASPDAPNYYARSKHALEALFDPTRDAIVRPGLVIGKDGHGLFQQLLDNVQRLGVVPVFGGGRQPLQTVHIDDLCEAIVRILERDLTGAFNVGEPDPPTFAGFLREMADRIGARVRFVPLPFGPVLAAVRVIEALRLPFPLRSESLLGLKGLQQLPVEDDLRRLGLRVRPASESLSDVLGAAG